ncbi:hypothetical protein M5689_002716 [Euphorbia peplus]|nr:hypothetical protein M5689_002716 [Euphorbia peplus]
MWSPSIQVTADMVTCYPYQTGDCRYGHTLPLYTPTWPATSGMTDHRTIGEMKCPEHLRMEIHKCRQSARPSTLLCYCPGFLLLPIGCLIYACLMAIIA